MANTLKGITKSGSSQSQNSDLTVYTAGGSVTAVIIIGFNIANLLGSAITVQVKIDADNSGSFDDVFLTKDLTIPAGSSIEIMAGNKLIINANDAVKGQANTDNAFDVSLSLVEQT